MGTDSLLRTRAVRLLCTELFPYVSTVPDGHQRSFSEDSHPPRPAERHLLQEDHRRGPSRTAVGLGPAKLQPQQAFPQRVGPGGTDGVPDPRTCWVRSLWLLQEERPFQVTGSGRRDGSRLNLEGLVRAHAGEDH